MHLLYDIWYPSSIATATALLKYMLKKDADELKVSYDDIWNKSVCKIQARLMGKNVVKSCTQIELFRSPLYRLFVN